MLAVHTAGRCLSQSSHQYQVLSPIFFLETPDILKIQEIHKERGAIRIAEFITNFLSLTYTSEQQNYHDV